ncbi:hypothetical protein [Phycicoccus duodecadis]|uniref:Lipoprotein n=1 Tax=Phycicoccus duodecadis TaxID=173053 RepID=A0A2N3YNE7_9MICO|nr:hypothetical protein [Phycicoccus duodecadis]PKW28319.1 hypothetical protein ATL31_3185 [Phycicoccus duodecadis]
MTSPFPRRAALRGVALATLGAAVAAGCTTQASGTGGPTGSGTPTSAPPTPPEPSAPARHELVVHPDGRVGVLDPDTEPTVAAGRALLERCTAVVVTSPAGADVATGLRVATALGLPLLLDGPDLAQELRRLGARTTVRVDRTTLGTPDVPGLPPLPPETPARLVLAPGAVVPRVLAPMLAATGARTVRLGSTDPRVRPADIAALRDAPVATVLGLGALGPHFAQRVRTARTAATLPGGGLLPLTGRRMVALYGHPSTPALGLLGEQGPAAAVTRAQATARAYARLSDVPVVPAFELIATVASGSAGGDHLYSRRTAVSVLAPWVAAARASGVYVVLDLQPGRADFLSQARVYESLLREPHVGLALDPEWRLGPHEQPLEQIGHVGVAEVNAVGRWLAALVRRHDLPPKVLTLHQFRASMVRDREDLDTGLDEIQWLVHADGQGSQPAKRATYAAVRRGLPPGVRLGWKNFVDEDSPMLTPAQTLAQVRPAPSFVSYQ